LVVRLRPPFLQRRHEAEWANGTQSSGSRGRGRSCSLRGWRGNLGRPPRPRGAPHCSAPRACSAARSSLRVPSGCWVPHSVLWEAHLRLFRRHCHYNYYREPKSDSENGDTA
jgi:hypothetical protein